MIAYKATHNFKCRDQEYKVGKTYTSDRMQLCQHGFHFCQNMEDVLDYYNHNEHFILLEIEVLGNIATSGNKSVTNKLKVLRVIPYDEYTDDMKHKVCKFEYDERGNLISETFPEGTTIIHSYDERNNLISTTYPDGEGWLYEYDERTNKISMTYPSGDKTTYEYDDRNNMICKKDITGKEADFASTEKTLLDNIARIKEDVYS
jgi:YD repeat-containing protein